MRRKISLAILAAVSALTVAGSITPAAAAQDSYCLQGRRWGYPGNCQFSTYQQCMASASGTIDYCGINPMRAYAPPPRRVRG
jgi:hypothetical protein